jgi:hypothetical protein
MPIIWVGEKDVSSEVDNAQPTDGNNFPSEEASGWDPYLVSAVNDTKKPGKKHLSESLSAVLDEMGDVTIMRRATFLRMASKN